MARRFRSLDKRRINRLDEMAQLLKSNPSNTFSVRDFAKRYDVDKRIIYYDLGYLRDNGHAEYEKKVNRGVSVEERTNMIKDIIKITGYISANRIIDISPFSTRQERDSIQIINDTRFYSDYMRKTHRGSYEEKTEMAAIKRRKITENLESEGLNLGTYWFAKKVIKNKWKIKLDPRLIKIVRKYGGATQEEIMEYIAILPETKEIQYLFEDVPILKNMLPDSYTTDNLIEDIKSIEPLIITPKKPTRKKYPKKIKTEIIFTVVPEPVTYGEKEASSRMSDNVFKNIVDAEEEDVVEIVKNKKNNSKVDVVELDVIAKEIKKRAGLMPMDMSTQNMIKIDARIMKEVMQKGLVTGAEIVRYNLSIG